MVGPLTRNWWIPVLRGVLGILFGFLVFAYTSTAIQVFVYLFGIYALLDGVVALALSFDVSRGRGWVLLSGIAGIAAGILTFIYPSATEVALVYIVAAWAIITGICAAVQLAERGPDRLGLADWDLRDCLRRAVYCRWHPAEELPAITDHVEPLRRPSGRGARVGPEVRRWRTSGPTLAPRAGPVWRQDNQK